MWDQDLATVIEVRMIIEELERLREEVEKSGIPELQEQIDKTFEKVGESINEYLRTYRKHVTRMSKKIENFPETHPISKIIREMQNSLKEAETLLLTKDYKKAMSEVLVLTDLLSALEDELMVL